jgi:serine/threonine-protein kinase
VCIFGEVKSGMNGKSIHEAKTIETRPRRGEAGDSRPAAKSEPCESGRRRKRKRGFFRLLFSFSFGIGQIVATTLLVFGIIGAASYFVIKNYVGGEEIEVPYLIGMNVEEALKQLKQDNLFLELDQRVYSDSVGRGRIAAQYPAPHSAAKTHTPVRIVISDGPARVRAPNLTGFNEIEAGIRLRGTLNASLDVGGRSYAYWPQTDRDEVIAQEPPPGTPIRRDSRINLLISLGPPPVRYDMPDLRQKTAVQARGILREMGLPIENEDIRETDAPGVRPGTVVSQRPRPGQPVARGDDIELIVASGLSTWQP